MVWERRTDNEECSVARKRWEIIYHVQIDVYVWAPENERDDINHSQFPHWWRDTGWVDQQLYNKEVLHWICKRHWLPKMNKYAYSYSLSNIWKTCFPPFLNWHPSSGWTVHSPHHSTIPRTLTIHIGGFSLLQSILSIRAPIWSLSFSNAMGTINAWLLVVPETTIKQLNTDDCEFVVCWWRSDSDSRIRK